MFLKYCTFFYFEKMSFISLQQKQNVKNFPVGYAGRFYRNLLNNTSSSVNEDFLR